MYLVLKKKFVELKTGSISFRIDRVTCWYLKRCFEIGMSCLKMTYLRFNPMIKAKITTTTTKINSNRTSETDTLRDQITPLILFKM